MMSLRSPVRWHVVLVAVAAVLVLLCSPAIYWQVKRAQGRAYYRRLNAELPSDPRFREVRASQPVKGPYLFTLDGKVQTQGDFNALVRLVEATDPPRPYNPNGVFVLP